MKQKISIFWFRRDLRIEDNHGLYEALKGEFPVLPIFIFDPNILLKLNSTQDARVEFILSALHAIQKRLLEQGSSLKVIHASPREAYEQLAGQYDIQAIYCNHDYEKYAGIRDGSIQSWANQRGIGFSTYKDQVIFEKNEVLSGQNTPYTVFTPYSRKWKERLAQHAIQVYPSETLQNYVKFTEELPSLGSLGFANTGLLFPGNSVSMEIIQGYQANRDFPAKGATSRLSVHLRFGTVSIRSLVKQAIGVSETWLNELIWRDFYFNILFHFPHVSDGHAFRKEYDRMEWRNNEVEFKAWCEGQTGYPIVDAGMRELNSTGFMHNRVRMIVASFLVKHLLIDWRWGESYFAEKLLDFDLAANNGGWQWAAGCGCDAAPYFRVFNPTLQTQKFDKELAYIRKWVPEFQELSYPQPIVNHEFARERVLVAYKKALGR
ncbi:cryptochrome/photolyase family protein [Aquirufa regiilacus]|uniref:Deoxyribodipyrimidine photo-lyase n=1 Tax=Aquirufa regiilacus TaxID=3024868 RepID=A0ABU3TR65_9BACT|nr:MULTISPECIES: deoxyribodipyrimidine photo-lyase [unclassified Aquirufa]MDT8886678.1 deoxyribodipyrimidine photo-lyase [Aquirufa sp. LEPPI-3A]MDU0808357.1 deoxyribodipyrimidine photo-lyase [Aquirufa sp. LEOWEIH-7C]